MKVSDVFSLFTWLSILAGPIQSKTLPQNSLNQPGNYHRTNVNQYSCDDNSSSPFQTYPEGGWYRYYCVPKLFWNRYRERNEELALTGANLGGRAGTAIRMEVWTDFPEIHWKQYQYTVKKARNFQKNRDEMIRKLDLRRRSLAKGIYEPIYVSSFFLFGFLLWFFFVAFTGMIWMVYISSLMVKLGLKINYIRGFLFFPLRKIIWWIIALTVGFHRNITWKMSERWFIWTKTNWKMWYIFRNHMLEEQPYWLVYRKPPNVINYTNVFLNQKDYHKHDMELYEMEFVEEMLKWKEEYPAVVALNLKLELGYKYESYFTEDFTSFEDKRDSIEDNSDSDSPEEEAEDMVKVKAKVVDTKQHRVERAKRFEELRKNAEKEFFNKEKEKKRQNDEVNGEPPPNPFKAETSKPFTKDQKAALIKKAKEMLEKYKVKDDLLLELGGTSDKGPTKDFLKKEEKEAELFIPLLNSMVWPHHLKTPKIKNKDNPDPENTKEDEAGTQSDKNEITTKKSGSDIKLIN